MQRINSVQELLASAARTTSGVSSSIKVEQVDVLRFFVDVTATSGTSETLDITLQDSHDGSTWFTLRQIAQITGITRPIPQHFPNRAFGKYVRVSYTIGGATPSFTFSIHMEKKA